MITRETIVRGTILTLALCLLTWLGARRTGALPALGTLLNPSTGVWAMGPAALPPDRESVALPGLEASVEVVYDDRGVPHIFAKSSEDAAMAMGYVVARDRLFQLEMRWRSTAGRLSELLGADALEFDRYIRGLGLGWSAERRAAALPQDAPIRPELEAYAAGVNAWIDGLGPADLPFEYRLLGARPSPWEPLYSVYLLRLLGWDLTYGSAPDRRWLWARALVGERAADALFPVHSPIQEPIQPNGHRGPRFDFAALPPPGEPDPQAMRLVQRLDRVLGPFAAGPSRDASGSAVGSNNWAVAPGRTAAGYALLAGDPHLGLTLPSIWYEVHLVVPGELDVYGATIPSVPIVVIGFNRQVAWSFTNTGADVLDFYRETVDDPKHPTRYLLDGEWRPLERRVEEYLGRDGEVLATDTLHFTHRGPLAEWSGEGGPPLSMRWTVLEARGELDAARDAMRAETADAWLAAMERVGAPAQNGLVADRSGTIAIRSSGRFPLRPDGNGRVVRDGRTSAVDWTGAWPVERYPFSRDPDQGYLASANQEPIDPHIDSTYLGADWPSPWRALRINALLRADSAVTPDAMRRYQTDPGNARAELFVPYFLAAVEAERTAGRLPAGADEAARLLSEWDRRYTRENERAVLFEYAMDELVERTWDELRDLPEGFGTVTRRPAMPGSAVLAALLQQPLSDWWDDRRTADVHEGRDRVLAASLAEAMGRARREHGRPDGGGWRWERIRHANIYHLLQLPALSELELPIRGGPGTLNPSSGRGTHGASWRMVVELGPEVRAWTNYPGGQSGSPASPRYADRIDEWIAGELTAARFPREPGELGAARISGRLRLEPVD